MFRQRLVAVMKTLHGGGASDPQVRRVIAVFAVQLVQQIGVRSWGELKAKASGTEFNQMLKIFSDESAKFQKADDEKGVLALEALALSLVAREQTQQRDLVPGVGFLDGYIEECLAMVRPAGSPANN